MLQIVKPTNLGVAKPHKDPCAYNQSIFSNVNQDTFGDDILQDSQGLKDLFPTKSSLDETLRPPG